MLEKKFKEEGTTSDAGRVLVRGRSLKAKMTQVWDLDGGINENITGETRTALKTTSKIVKQSKTKLKISSKNPE